jgi:hypothetical protein
VKYLSSVALVLFFSLFNPSVFAEDTMDILKDKVAADKKLLVATNIELTDTEAKAFWPVYESYQKDLGAINVRIEALVSRYAEEYVTYALDDAKAKALVDEMIAIEKAEADLKAAYVPKLSKALPMMKVARYLQIENKIRAMVKYDLAEEVPLVD